MDPKSQIERLRRGVVDLHTVEDLEKKLSSGRPLRVKLGVDPTAPELHLGHTVVLNKLRAFQDLGHIAILIIGDFTARVGDPSGRDGPRPILGAQIIDRNAQRFWEQASKILKSTPTSDLENTDPNKTVVVNNSTWLTTFVGSQRANGSTELFGTLSQLTVSRLLEREDFQTRIASGHPITMLEFLYPVFQGQDSVEIEADVELGGTDQLFNLLVGRDLQRRSSTPRRWSPKDETPQVALTLPLLVGTDGQKKMSKSYGNHIALEDSPKDMFGKTMSLSDETMWQYYELLTSEDLAEVKKLHPMEAKKRLASVLVGRFHGVEIGRKAREEFEHQFQKREIPTDITADYLSQSAALVDTLVGYGFASSNNEARRLIKQGGVRLDGKKLSDNVKLFDLIQKDGSILQVGSRHFKKLFRKP